MLGTFVCMMSIVVFQTAMESALSMNDPAILHDVVNMMLQKTWVLLLFQSINFESATCRTDRCFPVQWDEKPKYCYNNRGSRELAPKSEQHHPSAFLHKVGECGNSIMQRLCCQDWPNFNPIDEFTEVSDKSRPDKYLGLLPLFWKC